MGTKLYESQIKKGELNTIGDVPGVSVGHATLSGGSMQTGVTVIMPSNDSIFKEKFPAAMHVINGFGKTTGLIQIDELGTLESPIELTNTLSVGTVQQALVKYMLQHNEDIGDSTGTINVVVGECNDGYLNDIRSCYVEEEHVFEAIDNCNQKVEEGSVGAGTGMSCFEMKGGIGSASRILTFDEQEYVLGTLVLSNFGLQKDFILEGIPFTEIHNDTLEKGSCIMVIATNIPLDARQLKRVCKRMSAALARTGSYLGNGSGDIAIDFSTANKIPHYASSDIITTNSIHEDKIDLVFRASIDAMQESILSSLTHGRTKVGRNGHIRYSLKDVITKQK
ncbi:MAG: P1 family peptidase [Coprobacillaceae bacterium]